MGYNDTITIDIEKVASDGNSIRHDDPAVKASSLYAPSRRPSAGNDENESGADIKPGALNHKSQFTFSDETVSGYGSTSVKDGTKESIGVMYDRLLSFRSLLRMLRHYVPVAALLAVPVALFATTYAERRADGIRLLGLFVWLEVLWASLWLSKFIAMMMPTLYVFVSGIINSGVRKYHPVVRMIETPIGLVFWTIIA